MKVGKAWIIILCLVGISVCQCGRKTATVPADLIGIWETTEEAYADRFFEIKADEIIFATGEQKFDSYPITKIEIEKDRDEQKTLYLICYKNVERQEYKLFLYYDPANHGTVRFRNQKEILWTKRSLSSTSEEPGVPAVVTENENGDH